ncbi:MAG: PHP domain-containing protein [Actinobacteria bacterium]|nr:MAG: PHP domain-containing protein [Actinomycetota bacterium]
MVVEIDNKIIKYQELLNDRDPKKRLNNLRSILEEEKAEQLPRKQLDYYINNHIHTTFSFSYYTPVMSMWMSSRYGLQIAGIMDHNTISGAREFMLAGKIAGIPTTKGVECRADFSKTLLKGRFINNPDQRSIAYVAIHGISDCQIDRINSFFAKYRRERNKRNILMVQRLNEILEPVSLSLDFYHDVLPLSYAQYGGTVTERHILFALAQKIMTRFSKGREVIEFLQNKFKMKISNRNLTYLEDKKNDFYAYDILNVLKSNLVEKFYIDATTECPDVKDVLTLADETGSISAYAYLGDVTESVTGDKKAQKFEDAYLELLFDVIKKLGFKAVTYMPTRNSITQIKRVQCLCKKYGFFQICGEDINSPRQSFICEILKDQELHNLVDAAWALIGHEKRVEEDLDEGLFSRKMIKKYPDLNERVQVFKKAGKNRVRERV